MAPKKSRKRAAKQAPPTEPSTAKTRALKRRDAEGQVERIISNQFRDLTPRETDGKLDASGRTLRQCLLEEKRRLRDTKARIPQSFLAQLRKTFTSADSAFGAMVLRPEAETLQVNAELEQCVMMATHTNPNLRKRAGMIAYLRGAPAVNEKEFFGILNTLRGMPISPTSVGRAAAMELMAVIVDRGLHAQYPELVKALREVWDQALRSSWVVAKRGRTKVERFYEINRSVFILLGTTQQTDIDMLMATQDWAAHPGVLGRVTHNSAVGEAMFSTSEAVVARSKFKIHVMQTVKTIENMPQISLEQIQDAKVPCPCP